MYILKFSFVYFYLLPFCPFFLELNISSQCVSKRQMRKKPHCRMDIVKGHLKNTHFING